MTKLKQFIVRISKKRNIKIMLMFLLIVGFFIGTTYAQESTLKNDVSNIMFQFVKFLSWGWILLANLAGKLMTNKFLYGGFLHLDLTLYTLWNVIKNFANYTLAFLLLLSILKNIISKDSKMSETIKTIKNTLIAGVLVQMSWFLLGAVVDISTILTAAVGSFPAQIIASNDEVVLATTNTMRDALRKGNKMTIDSNFKIDIVQKSGVNTQDDVRSLYDSIMPSTDSLAGPLIYVGLSAFDLMEVPTIDENVTERSEVFLQIGINGIVLLAYTVMMFLIFLFNLLRLLVLWIVIPFTPLIIILKVFNKNINLLPESLKGAIEIKNIINLIFKPVIMTGVLSLILIVLILIKNMINHDRSNIFIEDNNMTIQSDSIEGSDSYNSSVSVGGLFNFSMNGFKDSIADIFVYILGICLIYFLVKISIASETGIKFIDDVFKNISKKMEGFVKNVPIIPVGNGKSTGIGALSESIPKKMDEKITSFDNKRNEQSKSLSRMRDLNNRSELDHIANRNNWLKRANEIFQNKYNGQEKLLRLDTDFEKAVNNFNSRPGHLPSDLVRIEDVINYGNENRTSPTTPPPTPPSSTSSTSSTPPSSTSSSSTSSSTTSTSSSTSSNNP